MKSFLLYLCTASFFLTLTAAAGASPLRFDYSVRDIGSGLYDYEFRLILDNNDDSWVAGQGWQWIVFGDNPDGYDAASPLTDFTGDTSDLPIGPYDSYGTTTGAVDHAGPTLEFRVHFWTPTAVGQYLHWSGTSTANLGQGELLISTIGVTPGGLDPNGAVPAIHLAGNRVHPNALGVIPEPGTAMLLGTGLIAAMGMARRRWNS